MSNKNYLPSREADLLAWTKNLSVKLLAAPEYYGVSAPQANAYDDAQSAFASAYGLAQDPLTRSNPFIEDKNVKKTALIEATRAMVAILQASPMMTNEKRGLLEISIRDRESTPVGRPTVAPSMRIEGVMGRTVTLCIYDPTSARKRSKVKGAIGAWVYSFVGEDYPTDPLLWQFEGAASKYTYEVTFHDAAPGARVWLCAAWVTLKGETGPISMPESANLQIGGVGAKAGLKKAA